MKRDWLWVAPALLAAAGYGQTESALAREGRYWVQTLSGTASLEGSARLRVANRGAVRLQGEERGRDGALMIRSASAMNFVAFQFA